MLYFRNKLNELTPVGVSSFTLEAFMTCFIGTMRA